MVAAYTFSSGNISSQQTLKCEKSSNEKPAKLASFGAGAMYVLYVFARVVACGPVNPYLPGPRKLGRE